MIAAKTIAAKIRFPVFFIRPILPKAQSAWAILFIYTFPVANEEYRGSPNPDSSLRAIEMLQGRPEP